MTNGQIADQLGISFETAKWHVSAVISKLGVESREEAAECRREQNWLPRRFARAMRSALPGLGGMKVAGAVAATAGVAGVAVLFVAMLGQSEPTAPATLASPAAQSTPTAATVLVAFGAEPKPGDLSQDLVVLDATQGTTQTVASTPRGWSSFAWSPDGAFLTAIEETAPAATLHFFRRSDWSEKTVQVMGRYVSGISWAPDSSRFVMIGDPVIEFRPDLTEVGRVSAPRNPDGSGGNMAGALWGPDNKTAATSVNGQVVILWPTGKGDVLSLPDSVMNASPEGWRSAQTLIVSATLRFDPGTAPPPPATFAVTVAPGRADWNRVTGTVSIGPQYEAALNTFPAPVPDDDGLRLVQSGLTADRRGVVRQRWRPNGATAPNDVLVLFGGAFTPLNVPLAHRPLLLRLHWDVVIVGGAGPRLDYSELP